MKIQDLIKMKEEYNENVEKIGKDALKELFDDFFKNNPGIESFRWKQYTPYFNDGDACTFSVDEVYVKLKDTGALDEDDDDSDEGYYDAWSFRVQKPELEKVINELSSALESIEDVVLNVFGDHTQVTVYPDRTETEEYEHD